MYFHIKHLLLKRVGYATYRNGFVACQFLAVKIE